MNRSEAFLVDQTEGERVANHIYFFFRDGLDEMPESLGIAGNNFPDGEAHLMEMLSTHEGRNIIATELKEPVYDAGHDRYRRTEIQGSIRQSDEPVSVSFDEVFERAAEVGDKEIRTIKSDQEIISEFRAKTEELFDPRPLDGMSPATTEEAVRKSIWQSSLSNRHRREPCRCQSLRSRSRL